MEPPWTRKLGFWSRALLYYGTAGLCTPGYYIFSSVAGRSLMHRFYHFNLVKLNLPDLISTFGYLGKTCYCCSMPIPFIEHSALGWLFPTPLNWRISRYYHAHALSIEFLKYSRYFLRPMPYFFVGASCHSYYFGSDNWGFSPFPL